MREIERGLSLRQPWAWLVVNGLKDLENRRWNTRFRGTFLIHAAQSNAYVNLTSEGGISFGEGYTPESAAHAFWTAMAVHNPMRARIEALEAVLRRVVHGLDELHGNRESSSECGPSGARAVERYQGELSGAIDSARELLGRRAACTFHADCRACEDLAVSCWRSALRHAQEP